MKKRWQYLAEYGLIRMFDVGLSFLPRRVAAALGESMGALLSIVIRKRHRLILENLGAAFPEMPLDGRRRVAKGVWKNIGRTAAEFIRMKEVGVTSPHRDRTLSFEGDEQMRAAMGLGKGVIAIGFHFGNWEYAGAGLKSVNAESVAIARPVKNPFVEAWVQRKRRAAGMSIILHRSAAKESLRVLRNKGCIGILTDQNLYTGGIFVDFFGRPAATTTLPALLHERTGAPIVLVYCWREGERMKIVFRRLPDAPAVSDTEERIRRCTEQISRALEEVIRSRPDQWFWIHNRWKRKDLVGTA